MPDNRITLWDVATGHLLQTLDANGQGNLVGLAWAPDGRVLVTRSADHPGGQGFVALWEPATGRQLAGLPQTGRITAMAWSPDGRTLAYTDGWTIHLRDQATGTLLPQPQPTWPVPLIAGEASTPWPPITDLVWLPDGERLAIVQGGSLSITNLRTRQTVVSPSAGFFPLWVSAWSPDGQTVAGITFPDKGTMMSEAVISNPMTGTPTRTLGRAATPGHLAWLGRSGLLAFRTHDDPRGKDAVALFDVAGGTMHLLDATVDGLAAAPDGHSFAVLDAGAGIVTVWSSTSGARPPTPTGRPVPVPPTAVPVVPTGQPAPMPTVALPLKPTLTQTNLHGGTTVILQANAAASPSDMSAARDAITSRLGALNVGGAQVTLQGSNRIVVELPQMKDPSGAIIAVSERGYMEWIDGGDQAIPEGTLVRTQQGGPTPAELTAAPQAAPTSNAPVYSDVVTSADVDGTKVTTQIDPQTNTPEVLFVLKGDGPRKVKDFTASHIGKYMPILWDKKVIASPIIQGVVPNGEGVLNHLSKAETDRLAVELRYGALPIGLDVVDTHTTP